MKLKIFQIDAFALKLFGGNPAAVVPLKEWLPDNILQSIAAENNLAETAFFVPASGEHHFDLRWFTPENEIDLCGHATIASAYVLYNHENFSGEKIIFSSRSGPLTVKKSGEEYTLDFPAYKISQAEVSNDVIDAIGKVPADAYQFKKDLLLVYHDEVTLQMIRPDFGKLKQCAPRGVIITAPSEDADFVCRFFAPKMGIDEDPATGSAQCSLIPYWSARLKKNTLTSIQLSKRKGFFRVKLKGDRVEICGGAVLYMTGEIEL